MNDIVQTPKSSWDSDDLLSACLNAMLDQSLVAESVNIGFSDYNLLATTQSALEEVGVSSRLLSRLLNCKGVSYTLHLLEVDGEFLLAPGVMTHWKEWASYTLCRIYTASQRPDMEQMKHMTEDQLGLNTDIVEETEGVCRLLPLRNLAVLETMRARSLAIFQKELLQIQTHPPALRSSCSRL